MCDRRRAVIKLCVPTAVKRVGECVVCLMMSYLHCGHRSSSAGHRSEATFELESRLLYDSDIYQDARSGSLGGGGELPIVLAVLGPRSAPSVCAARHFCPCL